jgi:hypothetical protein
MGHQFIDGSYPKSVIKHAPEYGEERLKLAEFILETCPFRCDSLRNILDDVAVWSEKDPTFPEYRAKVEGLLQKYIKKETARVDQTLQALTSQETHLGWKGSLKKRIKGMLKFDVK